MDIVGGLNAVVYISKQTTNSVNRLKRAPDAVVSSLSNALAMETITRIVSIKIIMARKLALGLKGYFYPQFFD